MNLLWRLVAFLVSRRRISHWLIRRSMATPYFHLTGYMERWWLLNPYGGASGQQATSSDDSARHRARRWPWLPSVRIHHILRADNADHPHDHPWNARTIILEGGYFERRHAGTPRIMRRGDTAPILYGDFHHIEHVTQGGVWTLFITWDYQGTWGFLVNGRKVPWREYEARFSGTERVLVDAAKFRKAAATHHLACRKRLRDCHAGLIPKGYLSLYKRELEEADRILEMADGVRS